MEVGGLSGRERIAEALDLAVTLHIRHLSRGISPVSRALLTALEENGPRRLSTLARAAAVRQSSMTQLVGVWSGTVW
jgi:DNA-binding MarR family transcriptional regulator